MERLLLERSCEQCGELYGEHDGPVTLGCQGSGGSRIILDPDDFLNALDGYPDLYEIEPSKLDHLKALGIGLFPTKNAYIVMNVLDALTKAPETVSGPIPPGVKRNEWTK